MNMPIRIGYGCDIHRLVEGRPLYLCGCLIPHDKGLLGHSDADAAVHALIDAVIGALALGDIGHFFPDNDPAYKGADSLRLLEIVGQKVEKAGFKVSNIDVTMIAQRPKLKDHIPTMRSNIARVLKLDVNQVNVKATTEDGLGFTGAGEGIAVHAVCLLEPIN